MLRRNGRYRLTLLRGEELGLLAQHITIVVSDGEGEGKG